MNSLDFDPKKIKRIIFDIDYTLLIPNYYRENEFFNEVLPEHETYLTQNILQILREYEHIYQRYDEKDFLNHLSSYIHVPLDQTFMQKWYQFNEKVDHQDVTDTKETLQYLKNKKIELVTLSNWFTKPQKGKLERLGLLSYFDEVYGGDYYLKPSKESFTLARGHNRFDECVMIGDHLRVDIEGAINVGMNAIYYTLGTEKEYDKNKIKKIKELKKIF